MVHVCFVFIFCLGFSCRRG